MKKIFVIIFSILFNVSFGKCIDIINNGGERPSIEGEEIFKSMILNPEIAYEASKFYIADNIEGKNKNKIICALELASKDGNVAAMNQLAEIYEKGLYGVERDIIQSIYWYENSSELNDKYAINKLDALYANPELLSIVESNVNETTNSHYQYFLGLLYMQVEDYDKGMYWLNLSAQKNYGRAQGAIGEVYELGIGTDIDIEKAVYWYKLGVVQNDVFSLVNLAFLYLVDDNLIKQKEAFSLFEQSKDLLGGEDALYGLGLIYEAGLIVEKDLEKAMLLFIEAAEKEVLDAQVHLGNIYQEKKDINKAKYWYEQGCNQGDDYSCDLLKDIK